MARHHLCDNFARKGYAYSYQDNCMELQPDSESNERSRAQESCIIQLKCESSFYSISQFHRIGVKADLGSWQFFAKLETFLFQLVNDSLISFFFSAKVVRTSVDVEVVRDGDGRPGHHLVLVLDLLSFLCAQHHKSSGTQTTKVNYCFEKSCLFGKFYRLSKKVLKELGHCNR